MTDKLHLQVNRALQAERLLSDDLFNEAFRDLEDTYLIAWKATPLRDVATREKLWLAISVLGNVRNHLGKILNDGRLAQSDLNMRRGKNG